SVWAPVPGPARRPRPPPKRHARDAEVRPGMSEKWRPSLAFVIGLVLAIVLTLPLAGMSAVVALSRPPETLLDSVMDNLGRIVAAALIVMAATTLVGFLFWRLVTGPMHDLVRWTEAVASRSAAPSVHHGRYGTRDLARLAA